MGVGFGSALAPLGAPPTVAPGYYTLDWRSAVDDMGLPTPVLCAVRRDRDRDRFAWAVAGTVIVKERLGKNEGMAQPSVRILCQPAATFVLH